MPEQVSIQVGGNVDGSIVVGDNNFVVNTNHGTIVYKQAGPQVRPREFAPQPPRPPRGFINRTEEIARLEAWIAAGEIVLMHAPDGMGKSSLLRQAANSAAAKAMPNGVILLEGVDVNGQALGTDDVIQNLFDALFESDPPLKVDSVSARTYLSNTRPLVLLDEVSLSPALQKTLPDLFPKAAMLMTADMAFGDFERLPIGPLPRDEAVNLLAIKADVTLNDANRVSLDAICGVLNDVALAIIITGNVLRETHTAAETALQAIQNIPASGKNPASMALDRAFSFAFSKLGPEEQKILSAAALTPGISMSPEWLASALGGVEIDAFIERLKALGLLFANSPRLRLPPGFRAPAQRAAVLDEAVVLPRLIEFLTAPLQDNAQNWEHIRDELGNFFGALTWAVRTRRWVDVIALGRALDPYLSLHGLWDAWNSALGYILDAAGQSGEQSVQAWALHQSGVREIGVGTRKQALDFLKRALELRRGLGDNVGMAYTQHNIDFLIGLPPAGHDEPKPQSPKPAGKGINPFLLAGTLGVAGILVFAILAILVGVFAFWPTPPTPEPYIPPPGLTATLFVPLTDTPTGTPTVIPTLTPTVTPTPPGGSGEIAFQSRFNSLSILPDSRDQYVDSVPGHDTAVKMQWPALGWFLPEESPPRSTFPANPLQEQANFILYTLTINSFEPHTLLGELVSAREPAWSPDGQYLAFASNYQSDYSEIYIVKADGSDMQLLTQGQRNSSHPTWSPDGKYIAFTGQDFESSSDIYVMASNGSNLKNLTNGDGDRYDYPEWSPDGSRIAYQTFVFNENWELFVMKADGSNPTKLTSEENGWNMHPSWSPDGKQIAFASNRTGSWDIYVMNDNGTKVKALTQDSFSDAFPDWSPDGRLIAFSSNRGDGSLQIYMMAEDGSGIILLTEMPGDALEADWRPAVPGTGQ